VERMGRRARRKTETLRRIEDAGWHLFRTRGYEATSTREIAEAADIAAGTLFNYFPEKRGLLIHLMQRELDTTANARVCVAHSVLRQRATTGPGLHQGAAVHRWGAPGGVSGLDVRPRKANRGPCEKSATARRPRPVDRADGCCATGLQHALLRVGDLARRHDPLEGRAGRAISSVATLASSRAAPKRGLAVCTHPGRRRRSRRALLLAGSGLLEFR